MKFYTFLPGLIVVFILTVLVVLNTAFNLNIPVIKNFKNPFIALLILGFLMCAFGTLANTMVNMIKSGKVDFIVLAMMLAGVLIIVISALSLFGEKPAFGFLTQNAAFYSVTALIALKIVVSTIRVLIISR